MQIDEKFANLKYKWEKEEIIILFWNHTEGNNDY